MILGIYTPYTRSEVTMSALRLADLAMANSFQVRLLVPRGSERGIHPYWDKLARVARGNSPYYWAKACEYLLWFEHQPALLSKARLVSEKAVECLVPMWHRLPRVDGDQLRLYDRIVCPTRQAQRQLIEVVLGDCDSRRMCWCGWDAGVDTVRRVGTVEDATVEDVALKLYVPMDSGTIDENGSFTLRVLDELLLSTQNLKVTVECAKSWPRKARPEIRDLITRWQGRLHVTYRSSFAEMLSAFHDHDWTFLPSIRGNTGIVALQSMACSTPVIAFDIEPFSKIIRNSESGFLISCDVGANWLGASLAAPRFADTLHTLSAVLEGEGPLHGCRRHDWKLEKRAATFSEFWRHEWGVSS